MDPRRCTTVEEIREEFDDKITTIFDAPRSKTGDVVISSEDPAYCIGGAVIRYFAGYDEEFARNYWERLGFPYFPVASVFAEAICDINPNLDLETASLVAGEILSANDLGEAERAWDLVGRVLSARQNQDVIEHLK